MGKRGWSIFLQLKKLLLEEKQGKGREVSKAPYPVDLFSNVYPTTAIRGLTGGGCKHICIVHSLIAFAIPIPC